MKLQVNEVKGDRRTLAVDGDPGEGWGRVVVVLDKNDSCKFDFVEWQEIDGVRTQLLEVVEGGDKSMLLLTLQRGVNP